MIDDTPDRFACETDTEIRMLWRYIDAVESGIQRVKNDEAAELERRRQTGDRSFMENFHQGIDHIIAHGEEIPRILKYTQIVALYSFLETRLGLLCEETHCRHPELNQHVKSRPTKYTVEESQEFLSIPSLNCEFSEWPDIETLGLVRNCVAHGNGWIERIRKPEKLRNMIPSVPGLDEDNGRIVVSEVYIERTYSSIYTLFDEAFHNLGFGPGLMPNEFPPKAAN
jgi:hypothetical protein